MPTNKIKVGVNKMLKPDSLAHYWKLKMDWELMSREAKKRADKIKEDEIDWARIKGKAMKLQAVLEAFENLLPKESLPKNRYRRISGQHLPIEIIGSKTNGR